MANRQESSIKLVLDFLNKKAFGYTEISKKLVTAARIEYVDLQRFLKLGERQRLGYIESLLRYVDERKWFEAQSRLDAAEAEYRRYLLPYIEDLRRQTFTREKPASWKAALVQRPKSERFPPSVLEQDTHRLRRLDRPRSQDILERRDGHTHFDRPVETPSEQAYGKRKEEETEDGNQPHMIAKRFEKIFEREWREAFEELRPRGRLQSVVDENKLVDFLYQIVQDAYHVHCKPLATKQVTYLEEEIERILSFGTEPKFRPPYDTDRKHLMKYRKNCAFMSVEAVIKSFIKGPLREIQQRARITGGRRVEDYAAMCAEASWWMCVQDPPVVMDDPGELKYNEELYRARSNPGTSVQFYIWPALFLGDKFGPVLSKGIAQCR